MKYELQPITPPEHGTLFRWKIIDTTTGITVWRGWSRSSGRQIMAEFNNRTPLYRDEAVQDFHSEESSRA